MSETRMLTTVEVESLRKAADDVRQMAVDNRFKRPKMTTLVEEFSEAVLAARGKHDDPLELELLQIASVCVNLIWQLRVYGEEEVSNLHTKVTE